MVESVSGSRFRQLLAEDPSRPVIDTRPAADFASWHIPTAVNIPSPPDEPLDVEAVEAAIPADTDLVLTVCGWGISSFAFAQALEDHGAPPVTVLEDGMVAWSRVYDTAEVDVDAPATVYQFQRLAKGCLGYLVACDETGEAVAIDVPIHTEVVSDRITDADLELTAVIDTHVHADHLSGGHRLAERYDVPYRIGVRAGDRGLEREHEPIGDGESLAVGALELSALATPGHTSDMLTLVLGDDAAVFTADTLFVDGVGRTELEADEDVEARTRSLYRSITDTILARSADALVLPGHVDPDDIDLGVVDTPVAAPLGTVVDRVSVLDGGADAFVERVAGRGGDRPPNYRAIILVNLGASPLPGEGVRSQLELGPNRCAAAG